MIILAAFALGVAASIFVIPTRAPQTLTSEATIGSIATPEKAYADAHEVELMLTVGSGQVMSSPVAGRLTSSACREKGVANSGAALFSVDGMNVMGLATSLPLWRNIELGDDGPDVSALTNELGRLGQASVAGDGTWEWRDFEAYKAVLAKAGLPRPKGGTVDLRGITWLPSPSTSTTTCTASVGTTVASGDTIAELPVTITAARILPSATTMVEGKRVVSIAGQIFSIPEDGQITDPEPLTAIRNSSEFAQMLTDKASSVRYEYKLADAIAVLVVPPVAIYDIKGSSACVQQNNKPIPIDIIASELGQSLVLPTGDTPLKSVDLNPSKSLGCR